MLNLVLQEITNANEPLSIPTLCSRLGIERGALEGMLDYWVRKGRLKDDHPQPEDGHTAGDCGPSCGDMETCILTAKIPRSYTLTRPKQ